MAGSVKNRLVLVGANGMLASMVRKVADDLWDVCPLDLPAFDMTDPAVVDDTLSRLQPQVIVNCAAYTNVDGCESEEPLATKVNGEGPGSLARAAKRLGATLVHISTDYVFDGRKTEPYVEGDATGPQSAYGRSKLAGELAIQESGLEKYFIVRTSWLYGPGGKNFVETIIRLAREREDLGIVADQVGSPTYTGDLAHAIFNLLGAEALHASGRYGIYHFSGEGQCSWHEFAQEIISLAKGRGEKLKVKAVRPIATEEYPLPAARPAYSVFSKDKIKRVTGMDVPHWRDSLAVYMDSRSN